MNYNEMKVEVFPTHVGMNQLDGAFLGGTQRIPHACGDEPVAAALQTLPAPYSPRMWG